MVSGKARPCFIDPTLGEIISGVAQDPYFKFIRCFGTRDKMFVWSSYWSSHQGMLHDLKRSESEFTYFAEMIIDSRGNIENIQSISMRAGYSNTIPSDPETAIRVYKDFRQALDERTGFILKPNTAIYEDWRRVHEMYPNYESVLGDTKPKKKTFKKLKSDL